VLVVAGASVGASFRIGGTTTLGRSSEAQIRLDSPGVSRVHARIVQSESGFSIEDLESRNGTHVNGKRVSRSALAFGDRVQLGAECVLLFTFVDPAEDELARTERLETLGRISANLAHDFNNILQVIRSTLVHLGDLPLDAAFPGKGVSETVSDGLAATERASDLIGRLLSLSRPAPGGNSPVEVDALVHETARLCKRILPPGVELQAAVEPNLRVHANDAELHQVLMNLCVNARDAMPDGGTLLLRAFRAQEQVVVEVTDTGTGIDEATRRRLFEPFFNTKPRIGTGLGLAGASAIVRRHGGTIEVTSELGVGSTFRISLPALKERSDRRTLGDSKDGARPLTLVVDDDPLVRRTVGRELQQLGYDCVLCGSAAEAIERVRTMTFEAAVLDLHIGRDSAVDLVPKIRQIRPDLPIVMISALWSAAEASALRAAGVVELLEKPCERSKLAAALDRRVKRGSKPR
jgi:signal transduction histidine kinase/ActR/RegA family two-component response regulator